MGIRYPMLAMVNLIAGGFLAASTFGFAEGTAVTLGFAISIAVLVFGLGMIVSGLQNDGGGFALLGLLTSVLAGWTVVATQVFADPTAQWLVFASAVGHVAISVASLILHEINTERVVHHLEVRGREPAHS